MKKCISVQPPVVFISRILMYINFLNKVLTFLGKMAPKITSQLLKQLRSFMQDSKYVTENLSAYIVPSVDPHNSEYLADCDKFRSFISGFDGSAGTAIITQDEARLWTDGRYYLQASEQLDSNWKLMKEGLPDTPTQGEVVKLSHISAMVRFFLQRLALGAQDL